MSSPYRGKTYVLGCVLLTGPTGTLTLSPSAPSSTGQGVYETARKASSPFRSLSGLTLSSD